MRKLLVKLFIKDYKNVQAPKVREAYGTLAGIVGIISNIILAAIKMLVGTIASSPAIVADGVNNFSDGLGSIITIIGFKISSKKADADHPFGHQRFEYITGMIISFIILLIGLTLFKDSVLGIWDLINGKAKDLIIDNPFIVIGCLVLSIGVKCWQALFYKGMGKDIDSEALAANSKDSLNDCITTIAILVSTIIFMVSKGAINIDSIASLLVAVFILISSISLIKETIDPLLGEIPSEEFIKTLSDKILSYEGILGIHDLVVHSYGPNMNFATVHAEVSREVDVMESHDLIDNIEKDVAKELNIELVIHMDPVEVNCEETNKIKEVVSNIIKEIDENLEFHDFRVVPGVTHTNILFDVVMPFEYPLTPKELKAAICDKITLYNQTWIPVIHIDLMYSRIIK